MDIKAIDSSPITTMRTNMEREQSKLDSFQSVLDKAISDKDKTELKKACSEFEGYFVQMMFKEMRKTVDTKNSYIQKSKTEEYFQELLDEQYAKTASKNGSFGLADAMYKQLLRTL